MTTNFSQANEFKPLLQNRVALVTGASRGIGAATAKLLAQHGASVAVNYLSNKAAADQVVNDIEAQGGQAIAVQTNVTEAAAVEQMIQTVQNHFGSLDTLILNAAGLDNAPFSAIAELSWEILSSQVLGELASVFYPVKAALPLLRQQKNGCIVAVSSGLSHRPNPGSAILTAGKASVDGFIKTLAVEEGRNGIRANLVGPGLVLTDASAAAISPQRLAQVEQLTPLGRVAKPEDVAGAILMLASEQARFITGAYLPVTGGQLII